MAFSRDVLEAVTRVAEESGIEPAALLAVAEVESGGKAFAMVAGRPEPVIRFEGHYFDRRLSPDDRAAARRAGLSHPQPGRIANPNSQAGRWRMLERAAAIDRKAAYESTSWGLGQVMGAHWAWLGFAGAEALVEEARSGAEGQARLMVRYIDKAGLAAALRAGDWTAFAPGYNGPLYARNGYHLKLAAAFERHARTTRVAGGSAGSLRFGAKGERVRELQLSLTALGHPLPVDGMFGLATAAALKRFQRHNGLRDDGIAGPATEAAIAKALASNRPRLGFWRRLRHILAGWLSRLDRAARLC